MYGQKQLGRGGINELTTGLQDNRTVTEQAHRHSSPCVCVCTEILILDTLLSQTRLLQSTLRSCPHRMRHVRVCKAVSCVYLRYSRVPGPASWLCLQNTRYYCPAGATHRTPRDSTGPHPYAPWIDASRAAGCGTHQEPRTAGLCRPPGAGRSKAPTRPRPCSLCSPANPRERRPASGHRPPTIAPPARQPTER